MSASSSWDTGAALYRCPAQGETLRCLAKGIFVVCVMLFGGGGFDKVRRDVQSLLPYPCLDKKFDLVQALSLRSLCLCVQGRVSQHSLWGRGEALGPFRAEAHGSREEAAGRGGLRKRGVEHALQAGVGVPRGVQHFPHSSFQ